MSGVVAWDGDSGPPAPGRLLRRLLSRPEAATTSKGPLPGAVLFDMDGLLVDSEPVWTVAETELYAELGAVFTPAHKLEMVGRRLDAASELMREQTGTDLSAAEIADRLLAKMVALFHAGLPLQPGAVQIIDQLRGATVPCALVSSSYRVLVDAVLDVFPGGRAMFDFTLAGDEVTHAKPHPEPYLTAAEHLGVAPAQCVVLEDSVTGATSAAAAGCVVVVVPSELGGFPVGEREPVGLSSAAGGRGALDSYRVASLRELTPQVLGGLVAAATGLR